MYLKVYAFDITDLDQKEYDDIFGDPNLFKNFGGFDAKEEEEQGTSD